MKRNLIIGIIYYIALSSLFTACAKKNANCNGALKPVVSTNSPVFAGDSLKLAVSGVDDVFMYNWYGPGGFSSHDRTPALPAITSAGSGRYTVDVITKGGCIYTAVTDSVSVTAPVLPCTLSNNEGTISGEPNMYFTSITGSPSGGSYFLEAHGFEGDAELEFFGTAQPAAGIYSAQPQAGTWGPGNVHVSVTNTDGLWYGDPGTLYISVTNQKITVSACSISFTSDTFGFHTTGTLMLTQQ